MNEIPTVSKNQTTNEKQHETKQIALKVRHLTHTYSLSLSISLSYLPLQHITGPYLLSSEPTGTTLTTATTNNRSTTHRHHIDESLTYITHHILFYLSLLSLLSLPIAAKGTGLEESAGKEGKRNHTHMHQHTHVHTHKLRSDQHLTRIHIHPSFIVSLL